MAAVTQIKQDNGAIVMSAVGALNSGNAADFQRSVVKAIEAGDDRNLILDLEQLSYISSAGLRALLVASKLLKKRHRQLALCTLPENVRQVMEVSGFNRIIPIHLSQSAAVEALAGAPS